MEQNFKIKKNDELDVAFVDLTHEAFGVAKVDGFPIFVEKALPGERGKIKVVKVKNSYAYGKLIELYERHPERMEIPKEDLPKYGGCQLEHMSYPLQLKFKQHLMEETLRRIGKLEGVVIHPIIGMEEPWHYRNKTQLPVGEKNGKLVSGFYRPRSHDIIDTDEIRIQMEEINEAFRVVKETVTRFQIPPYNETTHTGVLRHIMARYGRKTGELMVVLITRTEKLPNGKEIVAEIAARLPRLKSVIQNVNPDRTNVILGKKSKVLWGSPVIFDSIGDVKFAISARSFFQVNPLQTEILYKKALEYAELSGEETVIDAYCGIGTISLFLAQQAKKVYGVEILPEAIEDARKNADLNGFSNVEFTAGKAEEVIPKWAGQGIRADVLVVDPPRKGCDRKLLDTIITMKPKRIVYVSCNPATLARDLHILEEGGYRTVEIQPVDMFPQTAHVETIARIQRADF